jgi:phage terminase small subunit
MDPLTPKQAAFCQEWIKDHNGTQAAIRAGYSKKTANEQAARLLAKASIKAELERLQARIADEANVTVQSLLREAEEARIIAQRAGQASAMVSASKLKAQLTGALVERREVDVTAHAWLDAHSERQGELVKANEALNALAKSLQVPRPETATPEAIARAAEARGNVVAQEALELMRAARGAKADKELL